MSNKWEGFTEDDIKNLNNPTNNLSNCKPANLSSPVNKNTSKQNRFARKNVARERVLQSSKYSNSKNRNEIPKDARLYIPEIPEEEEEEVESTLFNKKSNSGQLKESVENKGTKDDRIDKPNEQISTNDSILSSNNLDIAALEVFEERQRRIKEQNRLRKEFLEKAIEDRTKKTHAEARRLHQIEGELKKLDDKLVMDVAILRNQIEEASVEFMEAQKRFDLSEREYLDAKLSLFNKKERKELLTSHLCTIIEHNELRKAKKLSELMEKLEIGSSSSNFLVTKSSRKSDLDNFLTTGDNETSVAGTSTQDEKMQQTSIEPDGK